MPRFTWGKGKVDGSFIPVLDHNGKPHYPLAMYTYGRIEIQFQWLTKPPFDDMALRRELLGRLNQIPGISLPEEAIGRRPASRCRCLRLIPTRLACSRALSTGSARRCGAGHSSLSRGGSANVPRRRGVVDGQLELVGYPRTTNERDSELQARQA